VFKNRAEKLSNNLKKEGGFSVVINEQKPRKGCFEVKMGSKIFLSLLDMPRPFTKLKALDFDVVANDIIKQAK